MTDQTLPPESPAAPHPEPGSAGPRGRFRLPFPLWWVAPVAAACLLAYYPVGMALVHNIDDDLGFDAGQVAQGRSRAVAVAARLIHREVDQHKWTPNDPFFQPSWALDNMPNFQQGVVAAVSRFAIEMSDQIGRTRGSSGVDADLDKAAGLLKYPGTVWMFDPSTSWAPTASAEKQYRAAARALERYNERLGANEAVFDHRADNLLTTLDRIAKDLGNASAVIDQEVADGGGLVDGRADDVFYATKGRLYAYALLLRELGADYAPVLSERNLGATWRQMIESMTAAAELDPPVVTNGAPDSAVLPSHLASQGFFLLRARVQLGEIADVLAK